MTFIKTTLLAAFLVTSFLLSATNFTLPQALSSKDFSIQITGAGGHSGRSLQIIVKNLSDKKHTIRIENGHIFSPEDESEQDMIIAEDKEIFLASNEKITSKLIAYCVQMKDASPSLGTKFSYFKKAKGNLAKITAFISKRKIITGAEQDAIWCLSDNSDLYAINGNGAEQQELLRQQVALLTNQELTQKWKKSASNVSGEGIIKDQLIYSTREDAVYTLTIEDEQGEEVICFFRDRPKKAQGKTTLNYTFRYSQIPNGKYLVKMVKNNTEIVYYKEVTIE